MYQKNEIKKLKNLYKFAFIFGLIAFLPFIGSVSLWVALILVVIGLIIEKEYLLAAAMFLAVGFLNANVDWFLRILITLWPLIIAMQHQIKFNNLMRQDHQNIDIVKAQKTVVTNLDEKEDMKKATTTAKKTTAKKASTSPAKKAVAKKAVAKKAATKASTSPAKKAVAKKAATTAKKTTAKKVVAKKATTTAKKTTAKKVVAKKATTKAKKTTKK